MPEGSLRQFKERARRGMAARLKAKAEQEKRDEVRRLRDPFSASEYLDFLIALEEADRGVEE